MTVFPTISKINPNFIYASVTTLTPAPTTITNFMLELVLANPHIITNVIQATPVSIDTPITKIDCIPYQTEEYKTTNYQNKNKSQTISYEPKKEDSNTNYINSNYLINEILEKPPENTTTTTNSEIICEDKKRNENINEEYYINSPDSEKPFEEIPHYYIHKSPIIERRVDIFSPIQTPLSNFEILSHNEESTLY